MTDDEGRLEELLALVGGLKLDMNDLKIGMTNADLQRKQNFITVTRGITRLGLEVNGLSSKVDKLQANSDRMQLDIIDIHDDIVELKKDLMALNSKLDQHTTRPH